VFASAGCELDDGSYVHASESVDGIVVDYGMHPNAVRGRTKALFQIVAAADDMCNVVFYQVLDAGGRIPAWAINRFVPASLSVGEDMRVTFQRKWETSA
jgi:hypothetical protein